MSETFCGRSCSTCSWRSQLNCPGCKSGPGNASSGDCDLAQCCQSKRHESCDTCTTRASCTLRMTGEYMPKIRLNRQAAAASQAAHLAETAPFLRKWLRFLFWLVLPGALASIMTNNVVAGRFPSLALPGQILSFCCTLAYGLILLRLSSFSPCYRTAGICNLVSTVLGVISSGLSALEISTGIVPFLLLLPTAICLLVGTYNEYHAHGEILEGVDAALQESWTKLWRWSMISLGILFGSLLFISISPVFGILILLADCVFLVVISVLKLIYLYQTSSAFALIESSTN